ncbi:helix-turn-helix domain-containing protein [Salinarimonas sp. NSM]|uniref:helix-turn-helix domain-containing protein n=1 Tax=Salinarimonas sp. NSM TaxID=3458003 RepID=UPI0040373576
MNVPLRTPADVGALIRARRRAAGLDQATLAARVGVSRLWLGEVERGKPGASLGLVLRVLAALDVALTAPDARGGGTDAAREPVTAPDIDAIITRARGRGP